MKALLPLLLLAGCGPIPRDPDGTLARVRRTHAIRIGVAGEDPSWRPVVARVARDTGAIPRLERGAPESLLLRLEAGALDLVVGGAFADDTPWAARVTLGPAIRREARLGHHIAARNGENAWIMLVERHARAAGAGS